MHAGFYLLAYMIPAITLLGSAMGGVWYWLTPVVFFGVVPILDELLPVNRQNWKPAEEADVLVAWGYTMVLRLWLPIQLAVIGYGVAIASSGGLSLTEATGLVLSVGITSGAGINIAHELMHRTDRRDRGIAELLMMSVSYTHFCVEHVWGHHKKVATRHDPATSRLGESVYEFLPRSIIGGFKSFLHIERQLVAKKGIKSLSLRDRRTRYLVMLMAMYTGVALMTGFMGLAFVVMQGVVAVVMLEVINYLEHYGLERHEITPERFERVEPIHSWSSPHRLTGWILVGLPRHADHHARAARPYPILRHLDEAPQLPMGYATMFLAALVPPIWRRLMNPCVKAVRMGQRESNPATSNTAAPLGKVYS